MSPPRPWSEDRTSIGDLLLRVGAEGAFLLRDSLRLVGAEAQRRLLELWTLLMLVAAGAAILTVALLAVAASAMAGLAAVMPLWGAALVVAGVATLLSLSLGALVLRRLRTLARPLEYTLKALEEGTKWLRLQSTP